MSFGSKSKPRPEKPTELPIKMTGELILPMIAIDPAPSPNIDQLRLPSGFDFFHLQRDIRRLSAILASDRGSES
jgi:hypothetical protein